MKLVTSQIAAVVVQLLSCVRLCDPMVPQDSLSFTVPQILLKLLSIESMMPSNHLILCSPLLLMTSIFPSIRSFNQIVCPLPPQWTIAENMASIWGFQDVAILAHSQPNHLPYQSGQARFQFILSSGFLFSPAHGIIQASQSYPLVGIRVLLLILQICPPIVPVSVLYSQVQLLCGPMWHGLFFPQDVSIHD